MAIPANAPKPNSPLRASSGVLRGIKIIFIGIGALILLFVMAVWLVKSIDSYRGHKRVAKLYDQAVARCEGEEPVVVIKTIDFYSVERFSAFTPTNPEYQSNAKMYSNTNFITKDPIVEGYYCTLAQATQRYPDIEDNDRNYEETDLAAQRNEIIQNMQANGVQLYTIGDQPENARLTKGMLFPHSLSYTMYTANGRIDLDCEKLEQSAPLSNYKVAGHDKDGSNIYYVAHDGLRSWFIDKQTTRCWLHGDASLSEAQGLAMMESITQADPSSFSNAIISR